VNLKRLSSRSYERTEAAIEALIRLLKNSMSLLGKSGMRVKRCNAVGS
jgi:hypothetical protein